MMILLLKLLRGSFLGWEFALGRLISGEFGRFLKCFGIGMEGGVFCGWGFRGEEGCSLGSWRGAGGEVLLSAFLFSSNCEDQYMFAFF